MDHALNDGCDPARISRAKAREYRAMFWASLPVFVAAAVIKRLLPRGAAYHSVYDAPKRGILADAQHMAHTIIPFAFWR